MVEMYTFHGFGPKLLATFTNMYAGQLSVRPLVNYECVVLDVNACPRHSETLWERCVFAFQELDEKIDTTYIPV